MLKLNIFIIYFTTLLSFAFNGSVLLAQEQIEVAGGLLQIGIDEHSHSEHAQIVISGTDLSSSSVEDFFIDSPGRIVVDIAELELPRPFSQSTSQSKRFRRIRIAGHPDKVRVVFDCRDSSCQHYKIESNATGIFLKVSNTGTASAPDKLDVALSDGEYRGGESVQRVAYQPGRKLQINPRSVKPSFSLDQSVIFFKPGERPLRNVTVKSRSDVKLQLISRVEEVLDAGTEFERRRESKEVLVSPHRFILNGNQSRTTRLIFSGKEPQKERVFRVSFLPTFLPQDINNPEADDKLTIFTGIGMLLFAQTDSPEFIVGWERKGDTLILSNTGNTNVYLAEGKACSGPLLDSCRSLPQKRLYSQASLPLNIRADEEVTFRTESSGGEISMLEIPAG